MKQSTAKPIVLFILDGWGYREAREHNPCKNANTPFIDSLFAHYPHRLIEASGESVGLPKGQIGNSEVGHLHLGAGRLIQQALSKISDAFNNDALKQNPTWLNAIAQAKQHNSTIHLLGLVSPGGVHSHEDHILAMMDLIDQENITCALHAILDGRDVAPRSATNSLTRLTQAIADQKNTCIASICGRYYAMDRDQRWQRTQKAYDLITQSKADYSAPSALDALAMAYARDESDEFVQPTWIDHAKPIADNDIVIFMNFRSDRARQLTRALTTKDFQSFSRERTPQLAQMITLTPYADDLTASVLFEKKPIEQTLGTILSDNGLTQLRLAETEKYAHVTYFFNGGMETPNPNETRRLIASPKVATYDLQPQMSALLLTDTLVEAIESKAYDVIICNYANPDMVGHTGIESAANTAMETMDDCLQRAVNAIIESGGQALITADHGNIECMFDPSTGQAHTAHTTNQVPLIFIGQDHVFDTEPAALYDVAPTLLSMLNLKKPALMTGRALLTSSSS
jgi:2,3-bisphosphoglycerate-independent phosphoglycerate mutase